MHTFIRQERAGPGRANGARGLRMSPLSSEFYFTASISAVDRMERQEISIPHLSDIA